MIHQAHHNHRQHHHQHARSQIFIGCSLVIAICFLIHAGICRAQSPDDIQHWNEQAWEAYTRAELPAAADWAKKAHEAAMDQGLQMEASLALNVLGNVSLSSGEMAAAIRYFEQALALRQALGNDQAIGWSHLNMANAMRTMGDLYAASEHYHQAKEHLWNAGDTAEYVKASIGGALVAMERGSLTNALAELEKALQYYGRTGNRNGQASVCLSLGNYYETTAQFVLAHKSYQNAAHHYAAAMNRAGVAKAWLNQGNVLVESGHLDSALQVYQRGAMLQDSLGIIKDLAKTWVNMATVSLRKEDAKSALRFAHRALDIQQALDDHRGMAESSLVLADAHTQVAVDAVEVDSAFVYAKQALIQAQQSDQVFLTLKAMRKMADVFSTMNQTDSALHYFNAYAALSDSLDRQWQQSMALQFQLESERNERKLQEAQLSRQRLLLDKQVWITRILIGLFFLLCLAAGLTVYAMQQRKRRLAAVKAQREKELKSVKVIASFQERERQRVAAALHGEVGSRLSMVKTAIKSAEHKMDVVQAEVTDVKSVYQKASDDLDVVVGLVRSIAHSLDLGVLRHGLLPAIRDMIHMVEQNTDLSIEFDHHELDRRFPIELEKTAYLVLQEVLHNAIKHSQASEVSLSAQVIRKNNVATHLSIMIEDNGIGFDMDDSGFKPGMGLKQIQARVEAVSGKINIDALKGRGTIITVDIPLGASENNKTDAKSK